jgi:hypothetical protein
MGERMKSILGAAAAGGIIAYIGTEFLFYPAMEANQPDQVDAIVSSPWDIVLYVLILVVFFDVFVQKVGNTMLTAMSFATAQILILDVFYVLNGNRAAYPAVLSAIILLASWYAIGKAYDALA